VSDQLSNDLKITTLTESDIQSDIVGVIVSAVMKTTDPIAFLNLRFEKRTTIGQKIFCVLFQELLNESRIRALGGHDDKTRKFIPSRIRRVMGAVHVLTRLGSVWSESGQSTTSPIGEYSLLIASLFGLVKEFLAVDLNDPFSDLVKDMHESGDLIFLKELQTTIPGFEIETSHWPVANDTNSA
jgi:hypothetical protein